MNDKNDKSVQSVDELLARARGKRADEHTKAVGADFVFAQLVVGLTYCRVIRESTGMSLEHKELMHSYAYRALVEAEQQMWKWVDKPEEFNQATSQVERLKFELGIKGMIP